MNAERICPACGTSIDLDIAPTELGEHSGDVSAALETDKRRRVRLILTGTTFTLVLLLVAMFTNRRSPSKNDQPTDVRQDAKPMIAYGEKPSPAIPRRSEVVPPIVNPRKNSQDRLARQASPPNQEANKGAVRADPLQSNSTTQSAEHILRLQFAAGDRLWIRVNSISRQPNGNFDFRGTLLHPISFANSVSLDQSTELVGSGTIDGGHVAVSVTEFNVRGENYGLKLADRTNRKSGSGPAVELNLGKILEMWFASASLYEKAR